MKGEFYTERDVVDLIRSGKRELYLGDEDRMTDLARDRAAKEGLQIVGPYQVPEQAAREAAATRYLATKPEAAGQSRGRTESVKRDELREKVRTAVIAKLGSSVDRALLDNVIDRVLHQLGR